MQYKVILKDLTTGAIFEKYIKNEYFLRKFRNKCKYSKKIIILGVEDLFI